MALITWDDKYSVEIPSIDAQHKKLIEIINTLHEAMSQGKGDKVLNQVMDELVQYTQTHFAFEEKLLMANAYPDIVNHKAEHEKLTQKVVEFQTMAKNGQIALSVSVNSFLKSWLLDHIAGFDKKYSALLKSKGVK